MYLSIRQAHRVTTCNSPIEYSGTQHGNVGYPTTNKYTLTLTHTHRYTLQEPDGCGMCPNYEWGDIRFFFPQSENPAIPLYTSQDSLRDSFGTSLPPQPPASSSGYALAHLGGWGMFACAFFIPLLYIWHRESAGRSSRSASLQILKDTKSKCREMPRPIVNNTAALLSVKKGGRHCISPDLKTL
jgi:hypothetical protein